MKELDRFALEDMLEYARLAIRLLGASGATALADDKQAWFAVSHAVQVVGEAASKVSAEMRSVLTDIPWGKAVGMRHHLVHGYREVRPEIVVQTIRDDFPPLITALKRALRNDPA